MDTFLAQLRSDFPAETIELDESTQLIKIGAYFVRSKAFESGIVYSLLDQNLNLRLVVTKYPEFVGYVRKYLDGIPLVPEVQKPVVPTTEKRILQHHCGHCLKQIDLETSEDLMSYERDGRLVHRTCHDKTVALFEEADRKTAELEEKRRQALKNVVRPILCNQCGKSCERGKEPWNANYGLIRAEVHGGYSSDELSDGVRYTFSICEGCLADMFKEFEIPVQRVCYFDETLIEDGPKIAVLQHGGTTIVGLVHKDAEELLEPKPQGDYSDAIDIRRLDPAVLRRGTLSRWDRLLTFLKLRP